MSLSDSSLLVYINITDFCILILCSATSLKSLRLSMESLGFLHIIACHLQIVTALFLSFQFGCFLFYFSCQFSLVMLNNSGNCRHPCHIPDLREKTFSFSMLSMMLAMGLSYMAHIMLCSL